MLKIRPVPLLLVSFLALAPAAWAQKAVQPGDPEAATGRQEKGLAHAHSYMAVAANPLAAEAGRQVLAEGGSAIDAGIAMQVMLMLVEPQSSGIGGGAYLLHWDAKKRQLTALDGRETAPAAARPDRFLKDGKPMGFQDALAQGRAVGTPGVLKALELAHQRHGKLPWSRLLAPTIEMAEKGFTVSPRMAELLRFMRPYMENRPDMRRLFYKDGAGPYEAGEIFRDPDLAAALRLIARDGVDKAFYRGPIGKRIAQHLKEAAGPDGPATVTEADLATYQAKERPPLCGPYRQYKVCSMGPSSGGGVLILQTLGMLEGFELKAMKPDDPRFWHLFAEANRRAYADRTRWLGDADFVAVPLAGLLDRGYIAGRAATIDEAKVVEQNAKPGEPPRKLGMLRPAVGDERDLPETSHLSATDRDGNILSMTTSVEAAFGSGIVSDGFILNNQLTDFSFQAERDGVAVANAPAGGKRPLSSMAPTIVFAPDGRPLLTLGSPGGTAIAAYVALTLVAVLDWGWDIQKAIDLPRLVNRNGTTYLEEGPDAPRLKAALEAMGHQVEVRQMASGLHALAFPDAAGGRGGIDGAADPRREGAALGD